ncbi:MAG: hypothetical protein O3C43_16125 [Verrucomicrobia bacterium]|nr:hypothetical protein [Verrucomicrobiota bacterium]MDA1068017.1 hypothetical protein [Verrucomicrobiota bacterium]
MPAKKVTEKPAAKKTAVTKPVATKVVAKKTETKKPAAKKAAPVKAPAKTAAKKTAVKKSNTTIVVKYDVGLGNVIALRGDAPGLSWETGTVMENIDAETWQWTSSKAIKAFEVKFLINDNRWSNDENFVVKPGTTAGFSPNF